MSILKIDLDIQLAPPELILYTYTREVILKSLGYHVISIRKVKTQKGYHFWIEVLEDCNDYEIALLQLLLGDDVRRAKLNFYREQYNAFKDFNILFSKKVYK
jgi:hypothetical protein